MRIFVLFTYSIAACFITVVLYREKNGFFFKLAYKWAPKDMGLVSQIVKVKPCYYNPVCFGTCPMLPYRVRRLVDGCSLLYII